MARKSTLGEFEHLVLLATLRLRDEAYAPQIARMLEQRARREMSRGTLYAAFERLEKRGLLQWEEAPTADGRGGSRRRRFWVTEAGRVAVVERRDVLMDLWSGIDDLLAGGNVGTRIVRL